MAKLFYSFKDDELYHLTRGCPLDTLMKEQCISEGLLIWTHDGVVEAVLYEDGVPQFFETRIYRREDGRYVMEHHNPKCECSVKMVEDATLASVLRDILSWNL